MVGLLLLASSGSFQLKTVCEVVLFHLICLVLCNFEFFIMKVKVLRKPQVSLLRFSLIGINPQSEVPQSRIVMGVQLSQELQASNNDRITELPQS